MEGMSKYFWGTCMLERTQCWALGLQRRKRYRSGSSLQGSDITFKKSMVSRWTNQSPREFDLVISAIKNIKQAVVVGIGQSVKASEEVRLELGLSSKRELAMNFWLFQILQWGFSLACWRASEKGIAIGAEVYAEMSQKSWGGPDYSGLSSHGEEFYPRAMRIHWKINYIGTHDVTILNIFHLIQLAESNLPLKI